MHCPECNTNNKQRKEMEHRFCGCCANKKSISFHRYVQWNLGWVRWLDASGKRDASVQEMNQRCMTIIHNCYKKLGKRINRTFNQCEDYSLSPSEVTQFYSSQFQGSDCKIKNNF